MLRASERWPGSQVNVARASGKPAAEYGDYVREGSSKLSFIIYCGGGDGDCVKRGKLKIIFWIIYCREE